VLSLREAVAQTLGVDDSLYMRDKLAISRRALSVAKSPLCRLRRSQEVNEKCCCHFRTTAFLCATASRDCGSLADPPGPAE
jgi:hypothetical protein